MLSVYLAGPEVFLPDGHEVLAAKRRIAEECGLTPVEPQAEMGSLGEVPQDQWGVEISRRNEELIAQADACLANLTPFRGVSADVGTVYELGLAAGLARWIAAYSNEPRPYRDRVEHAQGELRRDEGGCLRSPEGFLVEDHGMADNLMMDGGLLLRGSRLWRPEGPEADLLRGTQVFRRAAADLAERAAAGVGI